MYYSTPRAQNSGGGGRDGLMQNNVNSAGGAHNQHGIPVGGVIGDWICSKVNFCDGGDVTRCRGWGEWASIVVRW